MKKLIQFVAVTVVTLFMASCCKNKDMPTTLNGNFYTTDASTSEAGLTLYMDGENKGTLPYINAPKDMPLSPKDAKMSGALKFSFMSGTHTFEARKSDGTVVSSALMTFRFTKNKTESSTTSAIGGAGSVQESDNSVSVWLFQ